MRTPPTNWTTIMSQPHQTETRVDINNVSYYGYDGESGIWSLSTRNALFENFSVGNCHAGQIDLVIVNPEAIPTMAKMEVYVRLRELSAQSETRYSVDNPGHGISGRIVNAGQIVRYSDYLVQDGGSYLLPSAAETEVFSSGRSPTIAGKIKEKFIQFDAETTIYYATSNSSVNDLGARFNVQGLSMDYTLQQFRPAPTDWVRKGIYYIDTREWDAQHEFLSITGYDAMLKAEQPYLTTGSVGQWPKVDTAVVSEVCTKLGVELDTRTVLNKGYMVQLPAVSSDGSDSDTVRTVLGYIGAAYGGNWIITEEGKLLLVPLKSTATPIALGTNGIDLQTFPAYDALGIVHLVVSEEAEYTAGTTGRDIEISCPWGTQTMANNLLTALQGYVFQPLSITTEYAANPLWELGDRITFNGYTSVIADTVQNFGLAYTADISAPNGEEIDHEYPFQDKEKQEIKRVVAKTTASLRVDIDRIEGKVDGKITTYRQATVPTGATTGDLWYATADVGSYKAGTWYRYSGSAWEETSETVSVPVAPAWATGTQYKKGDVVDSGGIWYAAKSNHTASNSNKPPNTTYWEVKPTISQITSSQITQMVDSITLSVTSGNSGTKVTMQAGGITIDSPLVDMHVKALNIDGTISANKLNLTGAITFSDFSTSVQNTINGKTDSSDVSTIITSALVSSPNIAGGKFWDINQAAKLEMHAGSTMAELVVSNEDIGQEMFKIQTESVGHGGISTDVFFQDVGLLSIDSYDDAFSLLNINQMFLKSGMYGDTLPPGSEGMLFFLI